MALSLHTVCRIYGEVFGSPPFENASGAAAFTNTKPYPVAPMAYVPTNDLTIWPLANGVQMGPNGYYVYAILELPPTGANHNSVKLATDQSASAVASGSS